MNLILLSFLVASTKHVKGHLYDLTEPKGFYSL